MPRRWRFSEAEVRAAVAASRSWSEALRRLGLRAAGGNHRTLQRHVARWEIPVDHFDPFGAARDASRERGAARRRPLEEILVEHSSFSRNHLKERLYESGLKTPICEHCGQGELWRGARISLILDHINGIFDDNRLENLRIVCPNCAAALETHCGRKNRQERRTTCEHCRQEFEWKERRQRFCSRECFYGWSRENPRTARPELRKVERPPYEQLLAEVRALGWSAVGRKYGVSDNAIRKWVRQYEREAEAARGVLGAGEGGESAAA